MATAFVTFCDAMGLKAPVYTPNPDAAAKINTTATSQQMSIRAVLGHFCRVTAVGGGVCVSFGSNPTAVSGSGYHIPDGGAADFGPFQGGELIALIDA